MAKESSSGMRPKTMPGHLAPPQSRSKILPSSNPSKGAKSSDEGAEARHTTEHSFLTDVADVRQMEHSLLQLLDDFHVGKLQAFGLDCTFEKMDQVREKQERLARLHFDLDNQESKSAECGDTRELNKKSFDKLMNSLQELCTAVQNVQSNPGHSSEAQ